MILHVGNMLSAHGFTPTFIETFAPKLTERYDCVFASGKRSQVSRLLDMISVFNANRKKLKLVLIDSYSQRAFWFTYIIARLCRNSGIPYIPILHGGSYPERLSRSPGQCREIFANSAMNISPSHYLKHEFEKAGYKVEYIPNFLEIGNYKFVHRRTARPAMLWVRSFHETYNPLMAVDVLALVRKRFEEARLCMIGPDKDGTGIKTRNYADSLGIGDSLEITGKLSKSEWFRKSEEFDIFINTTNYDNHPVSVIEAMALGLPVVSTNVGGIPFLIRDGFNGLLSPKGDAEIFAGKVTDVISGADLCSELSLNGRKSAEEFSWENTGKKWFSVLDPIAGKAGQ